MRRLIAFPCAGETLVGTCDEAAGATGVLIASGGAEPRAGSHRWQATLAAALAARGVPAFRFDRRGVGDSGGTDAGWTASGPDLAAAAAAFRATQPRLERIVGLGNCDGATALALFGPAAGIDALLLANPWVGDDSPLPPPAAIRARYAARLFDLAAWRRLLIGGLWSGALWRGLARATASPAPAPPLAARIAAAVAASPTTVVLADGDRTAQQFAAALPALPTTRIATASHSFADAGDRLLAATLASIDAYSAASASSSNSAA